MQSSGHLSIYSQFIYLFIYLFIYTIFQDGDIFSSTASLPYGSSNGGTLGSYFFKPEKNLEFFRLKNDPRDAAPGRLE